MEANKIRVAKQYDKKVKAKDFEEGELIWKAKLSFGSKDNKFGNGLLIGKDPIESSMLCHGILIF